MAVPADDSHVLRTSLELNILNGITCPTDVGENTDVERLCGHLCRGDYGQVLKTAAARNILGTDQDVTGTEPYPGFLSRQVQEYLSNTEDDKRDDTLLDRELCVLQTGIACLQMFVQSNWTGPLVGENQTDILPSAYRQDQKDLLATVQQTLTCDGESAYPLCSNLLYFLAARTLLMDNYQHLTHCQTAGWWGLRCVWVHQQLMEESRLPSLQQLALKYIQDVSEKEKVLFFGSCRWLQVLYQLEAGYTSLHYYQYAAAQEHFSTAAKLAQLQVELTGAMGKRTRFQQEDKAQLVLQVHREGDVQLEQPEKEVSPTPKDVALDDDTLLNQMKLTDPGQVEAVDLSSVEQALVLGLCISRKIYCPKDKLTEEEVLAYVYYLLGQPRDWSVQTAALLLRCLGEKNSSRKVERSMAQLQSLVDQYKSLTPPAHVRLGLTYSVALPPRWIMERELAQVLVSLGALSSALDVFLRLHMWEDAITCYEQLGRYQKAEQLIHDQLAVQETPTLYCLLGDVTGEKQHYEKAWELSNHRSARAQRSLGWKNFKEEKFSEAISCFEKSVEINGLQNAVWFALGCAGMSAQQYDVSARGFSRCVLIDYDNFEAWNNLATSYIRMNQKQKAFRALQEALRCNFENWKIWENFLLVCTDIGEFEELASAYHRMLDLKDKHADVPVLEVLVDAISQDLQDNSGRPASRLRGKAVELFGRLTSKVTSNAQIWRLYAKLHGDGHSEDAQENEKALQCLQKAHRCSTQTSGWDREPASTGEVMDQALLLAQVAMAVSKRKTNSTEAIQILSAAKMTLRQLGTKVRKVHTDAMTGQVLEDLAGKLTDVDQTLATIQDLIDSLRS
ncbi:tetratricopeptide repeat protein 27-like [Branchiostoma lanceolatum]|uniref:tetratricopeptide repeat protein 27-like n=1 Tax=Branchiostoma lanceolatum TaxID=7740 RepID=UPI0034531DBB